mmetsp:Transcript_71664/g.167823  ORF Transcript_71664/g.167823 Transcript_71664/m.167823 type:complete len:221 (-) Transcript_71664:514-1176(-)
MHTMLSSTAELQAYNQAPSTQPERVSIKSTLHIDRGKIIQGRDDATHQISVEARRKRKAQLATVPFCSSRGRADSMVFRRLSRSSLSGVSWTASAETAGWTITSTPARLWYRKNSFLLGIKRPVPRIVTGTIGTFALLAIETGPFLNSRSAPSGLRVPSGKMKIEAPSCNVDTHCRKAAIWDLLSSRSMVIVPVLFIAQPTTGIFKMDAFETHLKDLNRW